MIATPRATRVGGLVLAFAVVAAPVRAQDSLAAAKELYASAAYDEALVALDRLKEVGTTATSVEVDQYRAFCLFALGRTGEAETVAESVVRADPLVELHAGETSPRIVALFVDLQKKLLPGLVREHYRSARASMEGSNLDLTKSELTVVQRLLVKAKSVGVWDEALADISVLVDGFLDLNRSTAERRAAAKPAAPPPLEPGPAEATAVGASAPALSEPAEARAESTRVVSDSTTGAPPPSAAPAPARRAIYSALDARVSGPVALQQQIPKIPASLALSMRGSKRTGILEVTIDERGRVENALIREPVNPVFDGMVLAATRTWQYQPARLEGTPVPYLKRIAFALQ